MRELHCGSLLGFSPRTRLGLVSSYTARAGEQNKFTAQLRQNAVVGSLLTDLGIEGTRNGPLEDWVWFVWESGHVPPFGEGSVQQLCRELSLVNRDDVEGFAARLADYLCAEPDPSWPWFNNEFGTEPALGVSQELGLDLMAARSSFDERQRERPEEIQRWQDEAFAKALRREDKIYGARNSPRSAYGVRFTASYSNTGSPPPNKETPGVGWMVSVRIDPKKYEAVAEAVRGWQAHHIWGVGRNEYEVVDAAVLVGPDASPEIIETLCNQLRTFGDVDVASMSVGDIEDVLSLDAVEDLRSN